MTALELDLDLDLEHTRERAMAGRIALRQASRELLAAHLKPPTRLSMAEWADQYRMLSKESSAEPGKWRTSRAPYMRGIMDVVSDTVTTDVTVMCSAQMGKTELCLNVIGYYSHQDPSPVLVVIPTVHEAEDWSRRRLAPMIKDSPALRAIFPEPRSRDGANTLLTKEAPGANITLVGANAPSGLSSKPIRIVLFDEVDRFPKLLAKEGDPIKLANARTKNYWNKKRIKVSTPTIKGDSRIHQDYLETDQRQFHVPCLHCGVLQPLEWRNVRWTRKDGSNLARDVHYQCDVCGGRHQDRHKLRMLARGEWVASAPENIRVGVAGFHLNALCSPWVSWEDLVAEFLDAQGDQTKLQSFVNLSLGEPWEEAERGDSSGLKGRKEVYPAELPAGVGLLTMGVDVQADRLELVVRGWGEAGESWLVAHERLTGDTAVTHGSNGVLSPWEMLDQWRAKLWRHETGFRLRVAACCIDTGYATDTVYQYAKPRYKDRVFCTKGSGEPGKALVSRRPSIQKYGVRLWSVGTIAAKDRIYSRLRIAVPGPEFMHVPDWAGDEYFDQLLSENRKRRLVGGRWVSRYEVIKGVRNEVLDAEVLNLVALDLSGVPRDRIGRLADDLAEKADRVGKRRDVAPPEGDGGPEPPTQPDPGPFPGARAPKMRRPGPKKGWMNGF